MMSAPEIAVSRWFNTSEPMTLAGLRGRPVLLHAFQMLCPGCVAHGTPQTQRAFELFKRSDLQVIGLHTVFEHHAAMTPVSAAMGRCWSSTVNLVSDMLLADDSLAANPLVAGELIRIAAVTA